MAITYTWECTQLETMKQGQLEGVAAQACFEVHGVDEAGRRGMAGSDVKLGAVDPNNFTALSEIDEATAVAWIKAALGPEAVKEFQRRVKEQINAQKVERPQPQRMAWMKNPKTGEKPTAKDGQALKGAAVDADDEDDTE